MTVGTSQSADHAVLTTTRPILRYPGLFLEIQLIVVEGFINTSQNHPVRHLKRTKTRIANIGGSVGADLCNRVEMLQLEGAPGAEDDVADAEQGVATVFGVSEYGVSEYGIPHSIAT